MELTTSCHFVTPPLTRRKQEAITDLLSQFAASVDLCIRRCLERNLTSRASLHHAAYTEWKSCFNLATHWFHSAGQVATQALRSWRRLCRLGRADPKAPPVYSARTMRLELWGNGNSAGICRFTGNAIQIRIRRGEYLWLPLAVPQNYEDAYLKDWREGKLRVGEVTISAFRGRANVFVPFKREVEAKPAEGVCGIDVNEVSVDLCVLKPGGKPKYIKLSTSGLASIAHSMELKQKSIQEKLDAPPWRPYLPHDEVRGTSSTCPMCGAWSKPNGHVFSCKACGYTCDRHFVGAYNIAVRWWTSTKDVGSSVPPEWRQMQPRVEAAVPPVKLEAKTQKAPMLQFATVF
jgi:hypothetical protein